MLDAPSISPHSIESPSIPKRHNLTYAGAFTQAFVVVVVHLRHQSPGYCRRETCYSAFLDVWAASTFPGTLVLSSA